MWAFRFWGIQPALPLGEREPAEAAPGKQDVCLSAQMHAFFHICNTYHVCVPGLTEWRKELRHHSHWTSIKHNVAHFYFISQKKPFPSEGKVVT